jgi:tRNA A-37 threonylcarbamoyl transferase component Bud32
MQLINDLEARLDQLASENRLLAAAKIAAEKTLEDYHFSQGREIDANTEGPEVRDLQLLEKDAEIGKLRDSLEWLKKEVTRLTETSESITATNASLVAGYEQQINALHKEYATLREQFQQSSRELEDMRVQHQELSTGMEELVQKQPEAPLVPHFEYSTTSDVPFKFIRDLGQGASGRIDEVYYEPSKRSYARKSIRCTRSAGEAIREIVQREVGVVRRLRHSHIISVECTYKDPQSLNIIISPVADCDLELYLDKCADDGYPDSELQPVRRWFACLASSLTYVHSNMIRHKDIKPANILVKGSDVILADFGVANDFINELTSSTESAFSARTFMYCAPEVPAEDGKRNRSADVFSLGCVFAEMATVMDKRSVADFFKHRVNGSSHAYHLTLPLVHTWLLSCACYLRFINLMLSPKQQARPSAALVEMLIRTGGLDGGEGITCTHR